MKCIRRALIREMNVATNFRLMHGSTKCKNVQWDLYCFNIYTLRIHTWMFHSFSVWLLLKVSILPGEIRIVESWDAVKSNTSWRFKDMQLWIWTHSWKCKKNWQLQFYPKSLTKGFDIFFMCWSSETLCSQVIHGVLHVDAFTLLLVCNTRKLVTGVTYITPSFTLLLWWPTITAWFLSDEVSS